MLGYVGALVGILAFRAFITVIELRITTRIGVDALHALRKDVFDHLQRLSMRYFDRTKQGRIIARADRDVDALEHIFGWGPVELRQHRLLPDLRRSRGCRGPTPAWRRSSWSRCRCCGA